MSIIYPLKSSQFWKHLNTFLFPLTSMITRNVFQKSELENLVEILIDDKKYQKEKAEELFPKIIVDKSKQKSYLNKLAFLGKNNNKVPIPNSKK